MMTRANSDEWVGLLPAGGSATRLQPLPCSKEILPIGFHTAANGQRHPKAVSHYLLEQYQQAGVSKTLIILKSGKWDIPAYYKSGQWLGLDLAYLIMAEPYGTPYTLDCAYPFLGEANVLLGFPDILLHPADAFMQIRQRLGDTGADVMLGVFPVDPAQASRVDLVAWDNQRDSRRDGNAQRIQKLVIKSPHSPLRESWIIAAWRPTFTQFMHEFLAGDRPLRSTQPELPELYVGHVIQAAIAAGLRVQGHYFESGEFLDVGVPEALAAAYQRFGEA